MTEKEKLNILLVDDRPENLLALESVLEAPDLNIVKATSGNAALALMLSYDFALVLLDVQMPDMDGFETAELMRGSERTKHVPLIFVTAISKDQKHVFKGYESGAVDYIFKPIEPEVLKSKVQVFLDLHRQKKSLEQTARELRRAVAEQKRTNQRLRKANEKILEQQRSVIEEERLKVLLQMAGATAHELNQPLMALLGNIELMRLNKSRPEKLPRYVAIVEEAGQRISDIVKKISNIHYDSTKLYADGVSIIDLDQTIRVLSVVRPEDFAALSALLRPQDRVALDWIATMKEAMKALQENDYHLVLLDYFLPDGNGLEFLRKLHEEDIDVPVVVITAHGNEMVASQAIQGGAYDYLPKEMASEESLSRSIRNALGKFRLKKEVEMARKKITEMSTEDQLTGLYNRRYFTEALEREVARAQRYSTPLALCMLDLDYFKRVNDTYGHPAGDMVLSRVGSMLKDHVRQTDLACRYGGEEFALILPNTEADQAQILCERFRDLLSRQEFVHNDSAFRMTLSIGVAPYTGGAHYSAEELIELADQALYHAKQEGRNRVTFSSQARAAS